jgi:hypothetical protein
MGHYPVAAVEQTLRHVAAHPAQTNHSQFHGYASRFYGSLITVFSRLQPGLNRHSGLEPESRSAKHATSSKRARIAGFRLSPE